MTGYRALKKKKAEFANVVCICMIAEDHIWTNAVTYFPLISCRKKPDEKKHSSRWCISILGATLGTFFRGTGKQFLKER